MAIFLHNHKTPYPNEDNYRRPIDLPWYCGMPHYSYDVNGGREAYELALKEWLDGCAIIEKASPYVWEAYHKAVELGLNKLTSHAVFKLAFPLLDRPQIKNIRLIMTTSASSPTACILPGWKQPYHTTAREHADTIEPLDPAELPKCRIDATVCNYTTLPPYNFRTGERVSVPKVTGSRTTLESQADWAASVEAFHSSSATDILARWAAPNKGDR